MRAPARGRPHCCGGQTSRATGGEAILKVALFASTRRSAHAFERQLADRRPPSVVGLYLSSVAEISGQARPADESHKLQAESLRWLL